MKIRVAYDRGKGWREEEVTPVGAYLCIHPSVFGEHSYLSEEWSVTHIPTGWSIQQELPSEEAALIFANAASALEGWDKIVRLGDNPRDIAFPKVLKKTLGAQIKRLRSEQWATEPTP